MAPLKFLKRHASLSRSLSKIRSKGMVLGSRIFCSCLLAVGGKTTRLRNASLIYYTRNSAIAAPAFDILFIGCVMNTKIAYTTAEKLTFKPFIDLQMLQYAARNGEKPAGDEINANS